MQAMNGYGASGTGRSARRVGCLIALVVLSAMTVPSIASAKETQKVSYIGLGDSLAFGYSQQLFNEYEIGCLIALVVLSAMTVPSIASAKETQKVSYIGLGDSLAFGYSQQLFNEY